MNLINSSIMRRNNKAIINKEYIAAARAYCAAREKAIQDVQIILCAQELLNLQLRPRSANLRNFVSRYGGFYQDAWEMGLRGIYLSLEGKILAHFISQNNAYDKTLNNKRVELKHVQQLIVKSELPVGFASTNEAELRGRSMVIDALLENVVRYTQETVDQYRSSIPPNVGRRLSAKTLRQRALRHQEYVETIMSAGMVMKEVLERYAETGDARAINCGIKKGKMMLAQGDRTFSGMAVLFTLKRALPQNTKA